MSRRTARAPVIVASLVVASQSCGHGSSERVAVERTAIEIAEGSADFVAARARGARIARRAGGG